MPRKRFTETPVEEPTEEIQGANDETVPEESNPEDESQIEERESQERRDGDEGGRLAAACSKVAGS